MLVGRRGRVLILKVRVATPTDLEDLLARIRAAANISTRTTMVLSTPYENRSVTDPAAWNTRIGHQPQNRA